LDINAKYISTKGYLNNTIPTGGLIELGSSRIKKHKRGGWLNDPIEVKRISVFFNFDNKLYTYVVNRYKGFPISISNIYIDNIDMKPIVEFSLDESQLQII